MLRCVASRRQAAISLITRALSTRPSSGAKGDWSGSEERTEQLRSIERVGLGVFIGTAPIVYGLFYYFGLFESFGKKAELSPRDEAQRRLRVDACLPPEGTPAFLPSPDGFAGSQLGYVFKLGDEGLGYYYDFGADLDPKL